MLSARAVRTSGRTIGHVSVSSSVSLVASLRLRLTCAVRLVVACSCRRSYTVLGASYDLRVTDMPTNLARAPCQRFRMRTPADQASADKEEQLRGLMTSENYIK